METNNPSESRLDRIERLLESLAKRQEVQHVNIESLHASVGELHTNISELYASVSQLRAMAEQDGEHIRALVRIAEIHEQRLSDLEEGE